MRDFKYFFFANIRHYSCRLHFCGRGNLIHFFANFLFFFVKIHIYFLKSQARLKRGILIHFFANIRQYSCCLHFGEQGILMNFFANIRQYSCRSHFGEVSRWIFFENYIL